MDYPTAKRRSRKEFGTTADVRTLDPYPTMSFLSPSFQVGVVLKGKFVLLGEGASWELAFEDAKKREVKKL